VWWVSTFYGTEGRQSKIFLDRMPPLQGSLTYAIVYLGLHPRLEYRAPSGRLRWAIEPLALLPNVRRKTLCAERDTNSSELHRCGALKGRNTVAQGETLGNKCIVFGAL
jgi:hypothetical protein